MDTDVKVQGLKYKVMATGEFDKSQEKLVHHSLAKEF